MRGSSAALAARKLKLSWTASAGEQPGGQRARIGLCSAFVRPLLK